MLANRALHTPDCHTVGLKITTHLISIFPKTLHSDLVKDNGKQLRVHT